MTRVEDLERAYHDAERQLRAMLFGDGSTVAGLVKGEERRLEATRVLRRMRDAFDAAVAGTAFDRVQEAETRIADLEEELHRVATTRSRRRKKADAPGSRRQAQPPRP